MKTRSLFVTLILFISFCSLAQENMIGTSGNIGIGTTTPSAKLDVNGNVVIDSMLIIKDSLRVNKTVSIHDKTYLKGPVIMEEDTKIKGDLIVKSTSKFHGTVRMTELSETANGSNKALLLINENGKLVKSNENSTDFLTQLVYSKQCDEQGNAVSAPVWNNGLNKIYVPCPEVNVGIGTSAPNYSLDVYGDAHFTQNVSVGSESHPDVQVNVATQRPVGYCIDFNSTEPYGYAYKALIHNDQSKGFGIYRPDYNKDIFTIYGNGKIEVSNSDQKILQLESNGLLRARKIKVDTDNWADDVFNEGYYLMPLDEIKTFISAHHHLPDVPSEQHVIDNGVDLVEMDTVLLRKLEEITLHIIEMKEDVEQLKTYHK